MLNTQGIHASSSAVFDSRGIYVFAVVDADQQVGRLPENTGVHGLDIVRQGRFGGVVTAFDISEPGITGELKERHARVLEALLGRTDYVPMAPGTTFGGADGVRKFLAENDAELGGEYERVAGAAEFDIRVGWQVDEPFELMADRHADLGELRAKSREASGRAARKIAFRIGRLYDEVIDRERREHRSLLRRRLEPICRQLEVSECDAEGELARMCCLVDLAERDSFERRVYEVAEQFGEEALIELTDAEPPESFANDVFGNW